MTAHHKHPEYVRNARIIRIQTRAMHKRGTEVICIGCGRLITPDQSFDVGHRIDASRGGSHALHNLGPQHRRENRQAGGRAGAAITNTASRRARRLGKY
jgi:5-methylcytosine-specific restriction endonuclease McrA